MFAWANISENQRTSVNSCEQRERGSTPLSRKIYLVAIRITITRRLAARVIYAAVIAFVRFF
jgi:hypothetical protein